MPCFYNHANLRTPGHPIQYSVLQALQPAHRQGGSTRAEKAKEDGGNEQARQQKMEGDLKGGGKRSQKEWNQLAEDEDKKRKGMHGLEGFRTIGEPSPHLILTSVGPRYDPLWTTG